MRTAIKQPKHEDWLKKYARRSAHPLFERFQKVYKFLHGSQFWTPEEIRSFQFDLLKKQYAFARTNVPLYRKLYSAFPAELETWEQFYQLPILTRSDMNAAGDDRRAERLPFGIKEIGTAMTSGSTGHVLPVVATDASDLFRSAIAIREMEWLDLDPNCDAMICRALVKLDDPKSDALRKGVMLPTWSPGPIENLYATGKGFYIDVTTTTKQIALFLHHTAPGFVLSNPSALSEAARLLPQDSRAKKSVRKIRTIGETLTPEDVATLSETFEADIQDHYSSAEVNVIATTAPDGDGHLVHDENVLLETVREDGSRCEIGEEGRIVVTNLQPYATPFIRYDIADLGILGEHRGAYGLTRLEKLTGRRMELLRTSSGGRIHVSSVFMTMHRISGLRGMIIRQLDIGSFEILVTQLPDCEPGFEQRIVEQFSANIPEPVQVEVKIVDELPRTMSGKLQKFQYLGPDVT